MNGMNADTGHDIGEVMQTIPPTYTEQPSAPSNAFVFSTTTGSRSSSSISACSERLTS